MKKFNFFKGLFTLIMAVALTFTLIACEESLEQAAIDEALESIEVVFTEGDDIDSVTEDLTLPTSFGDVTIVWASGNPNVIANDGTVTRGFNDVNVTLTATATYGEFDGSTQFVVKVLGYDVDAALAAIELTGEDIAYDEETEIYTATGDFTVPETTEGLDITWTALSPSVVSISGEVVRPAYGQGDALVALIAEINGEEREFDILVPAITEAPDEDMVILENARDSLLLSGIGDGVSQDVNLPLTVGQQGVTVTWESTHPEIISETGEVVRQTTNRTVVLTATLHYNEKMLTKEFEVVVLAAEDFVPVESIDEALEISVDGEGAVTRTYVLIEGVTILGITNDGVVFHDGESLLFAYMGSRIDSVVVGESYDVFGLTDRYFGSWQLSNTANAAQPVVFLESDEPAQDYEPVVVDSVTDMLALTEIPDPDMTYEYYRLTTKVRIQGTGNYDTVFVDPDYEGDDIPTAPNSPHADQGVMIYYQSNKAAFNAFDGQVVTFDALLYSYRSDRTVFTILFLGTVDDIQISLPDEELLDLVEETVTGSIDEAYTAETTLDLPDSLLGADISWASESPLIDLETGLLTMPEEGMQEEVLLTATLSINDTEREVEISIMAGELDVISILEAREMTTGKVRVQGVITAQLDNASFLIQDSTSGLGIFSYDFADMLSGAVGKEVDMIATRGAYNGLEQLSPIEVTVLDDASMPAARSITNVPFTATDLLPYQAQLVSAEGLQVVETSVDNWGNIIVVFMNEAQEEIEMRWDSRVEGTDTSSIEALEAGDFVNLVGAPLSWRYDEPYLYYSDPSQITEAEYIPQTDEERVVAAMDTLDIPTEIGENQTLVLPTEGPYGVSIAWESNNAAIDAETGEVTVTGETVDVELTATLSLNDVEELALFQVTVGYITLTVLEAREAEVGTQVTVEAVVTAVSFDGSDRGVVFVEDETAGIYLYKVPADYAAHLVVGNRIKVTGNRAVYSNLAQMNGFLDVQLLEEGLTVEATPVLDPATLPEVEGQLVTVTGFLAETYSGTPSDYHLVTDMGTFALRLVSGSDAPAAQRDTVYDALVGVEAGTEVTVEAGVGRFWDNFQIMLFDGDMITIGELGSDEDLLAAALANAGLPENGSEIETDIELPTEGLFGTQFGWASDNADALTPEGVVTRPTYEQGDALVTLSLTVTIDDEVVHEQDIEIIVLAGEMEISTIAEAREITDGMVRVQGVITARLDNGSYLIQDDTSGLGIYDFDFDLGSLIGMEVDVIADRGAYNGLEQLSLIEVNVLGEGTMPEPQSIDGVSFTELLPFQAQLVSVEGLEVLTKEVDGWGNIILTLQNAAEEEIGMRWDSRLEGTDTSAIEALEVGDMINLVGAPLSWSNGPRLYYTDPSQIEYYEFPETTVAFARAAELEAIVTIEAVVTAVSFDNDGRAVAFVQDGTAGIYLYKVPADYQAHMVVGNLIQVTGERGVFASGKQLVDITDVQLLEEDIDVDSVVVEDPAELADVQGQFVSVTGFLAETYSGTPSDYHLVTEMGTFALRLVSGSDAPAAQRDAVIDALVGVEAGTEITIEAGAGRYYDNFQIMLFNDSMITVGAMGTPEQLGAVVLADLELPEANDEVVSSIVLPTEGLFGATVTWLSDNEEVISNTGAVTRPTDMDATVVLSYTVELGEDVLAEGDITFTVLADVEPVEPELDLFFSEYIEGGSNNKALEIYNPTAEEVDLTPYVVELYSNGRLESAGATNSLDLAGTLAPGAVLVIVNSSATEAFKVGDFVESAVTYFNGDDALVLRNDGAIIDSIGQLGVDPGSAWSANDVSTANMTLVRMPSVHYGRTDATSEFDPSLEWIAYPQDTSEYLGVHEMDPVEEEEIEPFHVYHTGFEDADPKTSYALGTIEARNAAGDSETWELDNVLRGNHANDKKNDDWSLRSRSPGTATILNEYEGLHLVIFFWADYGTSSGGELNLQFSVDQGDTWHTLASFSNNQTLTQEFVYVDYSDPIVTNAGATETSMFMVRFEFAGQSTLRMNIDDVAIFTLPPAGYGA
jgi:uncharacterized protein YdeI (BOF family)